MQPSINKFNAPSHGAATLIMTLVLLTLSSLLIIFAANYGKLQTKSIANIGRNQQAFEAAQAGLEFGINYLNTNNTTILANPVSGYIPAYTDGNMTNVTLANGSKFTITYSNPVANNYTLIKVSSTGTSDDSSSTHVVSQLVQFGSMLLNAPTVPLTSKGVISLGGNSQIVNTYSDNTIKSAQGVSISGSGSTVIASGPSSTSGDIKSDVQQNLSSLASMSSNDFFLSYFGLAPANIKSSVGNYYSNGSSTNYSSTLNGKTGTSIWIDQASGLATLNGTTTIGTAANPVLLIINGAVKFSGNVTIYGYVYILGSSDTDLAGNVTIVGGMATTDDLIATGSIQVVFSPSVLANLQNINSMRYYAKIPGSWKDF